MTSSEESSLPEASELKEWQLKEVKSALEEADKGDFASDQVVVEMLRFWGMQSHN